MKPRSWSVVLHLHADASVTVRVHVEARILLPICDSQSVERAIAYVESILVDSRPDDRIVLRAQDTVSTPRTLTAPNTETALAWLRERSAEMSRALASTRGADSDEGARSGTRAALRDAAQAAPAQAKKSVP